MKNFLFFLLFICLSSCIPFSIAPTFQKKGYKVKEAKRFKRQLPKQNAFIFVDPKEADEFYNFVNTKFELYDLDVDYEVPFRIEGKLYYLSFYEVEKSTTTLNLLPIFIDGATGGNDFEDDYAWRDGTWYIVITIIDNNSKDSLKESHPKHKEVIQYLKDLKQEYVSSQSDEELLLAKKS